MNEQTSDQQSLIHNPERDILNSPFDLVTRGLNESERIEVTQEQIYEARLQNEKFKELSNLAIKIVLEQKPYWEHKLAAEIFGDQIRAAETLLMSVITGQGIVRSNTVTRDQMVDWFKSKMHVLKLHISQSCTEFNDQYRQVNSSAGNIDLILDLGSKYGLIYSNYSPGALRVEEVASEDVLQRQQDLRALLAERADIGTDPTERIRSLRAPETA